MHHEVDKRLYNTKNNIIYLNIIIYIYQDSTIWYNETICNNRLNNVLKKTLLLCICVSERPLSVEITSLLTLQKYIIFKECIFT